MRLSRIFTDNPLAVNTSVTLVDQRAHYLLNVLRLTEGQSVVLFNGSGGEYLATIVNTGKKTVTLSIHNFDEINRSSPLQTHLAIAVSQADKIDWVLQKTTELGVSEITLLNTERTKFKLSAERLVKKNRHWQEIIISACEQCGRNILPRFNGVKPYLDFVQTPVIDLAFLLHPQEDGLDIANALKEKKLLRTVTFLIGPEGGFSDEEIHWAQTHCYRAISMGPRILRMETAPIAALAILQSFGGDF